jgi:HEPN domain-containing protein
MSGHKIVSEWLRYAQNDLIVAKHCIEDLYPKQTEIAGYHCQQCAEKALKAFLIYNDIEPPKIHDLKVLCKICQDINALFAEIATPCAHLTIYGVAVRYPDEFSPDVNMIKLAINEALHIYDLVFSSCSNAVAPGNVES